MLSFLLSIMISTLCNIIFVLFDDSVQYQFVAFLSLCVLGSFSVSFVFKVFRLRDRFEPS